MLPALLLDSAPSLLPSAVAVLRLPLRQRPQCSPRLYFAKSGTLHQQQRDYPQRTWQVVLRSCPRRSARDGTHSQRSRRWFRSLQFPCERLAPLDYGSFWSLQTFVKVRQLKVVPLETNALHWLFDRDYHVLGHQTMYVRVALLA